MFENINKKYKESLISREFYDLYNQKTIDTLSLYSLFQKINDSKMVFPEKHFNNILNTYLYSDAININAKSIRDRKPLLAYRHLNHLSSISDLIKKYPFPFASMTLQDVVSTFIRVFSIPQVINYISNIDDDLFKKEIDMIHFIVVLCNNHKKKDNLLNQYTNILIRIHQHKPLLYSNPEISNETFKRMLETGLLLNMPITEILTNIKENNIQGMVIPSLDII